MTDESFMLRASTDQFEMAAPEILRVLRIIHNSAMDQGFTEDQAFILARDWWQNIAIGSKA